MTLNRDQIETAVRRAGANLIAEETGADAAPALVFEAEGVRFIAFLSLEERKRFGALKLWAGFQGGYDPEFVNRLNRQFAVSKAVVTDEGGLVVTFDVLLYGLSEMAVTKAVSFFLLDIKGQLSGT